MPRLVVDWRPECHQRHSEILQCRVELVVVNLVREVLLPGSWVDVLFLDVPGNRLHQVDQHHRPNGNRDVRIVEMLLTDPTVVGDPGFLVPIE